MPAEAYDPRAAPRLRIDSRRKWFPDLGAVVQASHLIRLFARRDITVRYRQTVLGAIWIVAGPLASAGLFSFVFGRIAGLSSGGDPYIEFAFAALIGWNMFADTLISVSRSLTANSNLITKIYFPRLVLPLSTVGSTLISAGVSLVVMALLLLFSGTGLTLRVLVLPAWALLAIGLAIGVGLVLAAAAVSLRDVTYVTQVAVPLLMFLTPVAYGSGEVPAGVRDLFFLNPVATIVEGFRWSLLGHADLSAWAVVYTAGFTAAIVVLGLAVFARLEWRFADVI